PSAEEEARLARLRRKLFEAREARVHPGLDDKILADWNGLMIAALVNAATLLGEHGWIERAVRAYDFIVSTMLYLDGDSEARLAHSWRAGVLVKPGLALDYAAMMRAALALYEARNLTMATRRRDYLSDALGFAEALETYHLNAETGLLCMAAKDAGDVILRLAPTYDDAIPNAHPVYLSALVRVAGLTGDAKWLARADALFKAVAPLLRANLVGHAGVLNALDLRLRGKEIVTVGPQRAALYQAALAAPFIDRTVMDIDSLDAGPDGHPAHAQAQMAGEAAAFVCSGGACSLPARDVEALRRVVASR
ncbi:MAG: thioredoxin domain-containing protein, partial [Roseiarcus sp.]